MRSLVVVAIMASGLPAATLAAQLGGSVRSGGAGNASGTGVHMRATLGQVAIGRAAGASSSLASGFWYGGAAPPVVSAAEAPPVAALFLDQNHPNPFNPVTTLRFSLEEAARVRLDVMGPSGRLVTTLHDGMASAGVHVATWHGRDLFGREVASGIYVARLTGPGFRRTVKMNLLR